MADALDEAADELGRIDAVAGDGDHGRGMTKGSAAARAAAAAAARDGAGVATVLSRAGDAWAATAGGTSGVLWGAALSAVGAALGDDAEDITSARVADAIRAGLDMISTLGKAKVRDKTMLDALVPFVDTLDEQIATGASLTQAWITAAGAAEQSAQATADLRPQVGRARPLAQRSVGTPDPGAVSLALCVRIAGAVLTDR
jgi:dihydroxyacetone kinase